VYFIGNPFWGCCIWHNTSPLVQLIVQNIYFEIFSEKYRILLLFLDCYGFCGIVSV